MLPQESVSALIPVYNAEKYLAEAIESVLNQKDVEPLEIIVLDDGSTDKSAEIAESFKPRISFFQQTNRGISAARNAAFQKAEGDYLAFLDADDYWTNDHLLKLCEPFQTDENLDIAMGYVEQFISEDAEKPHGKIPEGMEVLPGYVIGATLIKRTVFNRVGLFNEELTLADTVDLFARVNDAGLSLKMIKEIVLKRRIHSTNTGIKHREKRHDYTKVLMASIKRKRERENNENK